MTFFVTNKNLEVIIIEKCQQKLTQITWVIIVHCDSFLKNATVAFQTW